MAVTEIIIYYMRDNHTFKKLTNDLNTALSEIEHEFNQGFTHGALVSKAKGFKDVQARGAGERLEFFAECKAELEKWLVKEDGEPLANHELQCVCGAVWCGDEMVHPPNKTTPPKREWQGLTDDEVSKLIDNEIGFNSCCGWEEEYTRAVEAKLKEKNHDSR